MKSRIARKMKSDLVPAKALVSSSARSIAKMRGRTLDAPVPKALDAGLLVILLRPGKGKTSREYGERQPVFGQGDAADAVFYLQTGRVKVTVVSNQGKEAVVAILLQGSFFGEGCLAGQTRRIASASAMQHSTIIRISKTAVMLLLQREPEFAGRFVAHLLSRNVRIESDLVDQLFNSSEKRLARLLLLLANFGQEAKPIPVIANMSQETLADMIGTTRSRVSFFMNRFRKLGFINYNRGGLQIHSSLVSVVLHD
ncbi:MAG TPA: Crp/Fnr family transcriptional regulator [Candidatus Koribacter sp.]|jgi:CRP-like cAMP-binding protein